MKASESSIAPQNGIQALARKAEENAALEASAGQKRKFVASSDSSVAVAY
jgi:hypothetical protein